MFFFSVNNQLSLQVNINGHLALLYFKIRASQISCSVWNRDEYDYSNTHYVIIQVSLLT